MPKVNIPHLVEKIGGFDVEKDWDDVLFSGEKHFVKNCYSGLQKKEDFYPRF